MLFLSQIGVHRKRLVQIKLFLLLVDLDLDVLLDISQGLDGRVALSEGMDGRVRDLSDVRHGVRMAMSGNSTPFGSGEWAFGKREGISRRTGRWEPRGIYGLGVDLGRLPYSTVPLSLKPPRRSPI